MTSLLIADPLPPGEWERYPASLAEDAYRDGWTQRLGGPRVTYPRQLNSGELTAWTRGHAAAHQATACVRRVGEPLRPPAPAAKPVHTPLHTPPPRPEAELASKPAPRLQVSSEEASELGPRQPATDAALLIELLELQPPAAVAPYFDGSQLCAQVDPELFFPEKGGSTRAAKELCARCEFRDACLDYALHAHVAGYPIAGIWGGTSVRDRLALLHAAGDLDDVDLLDEGVA